MPATCEQVDCKTAASWLMSIASANLGHESKLDASVAALQAQEALYMLSRSERSLAELLRAEQRFALSNVQQTEQPHSRKTALNAQTVACSSAVLESSPDSLIAWNESR